MRNDIIQYNANLKERARKLRKNATEAEIIFWSCIRKKKLGVEFHRQVPIKNFIVDFYNHELKLAVEIDGSSHIGKEDYDSERQKVLESYNITVVRFKNSEIKTNIAGDIDLLIAKISELKNVYTFKGGNFTQ